MNITGQSDCRGIILDCSQYDGINAVYAYREDGDIHVYEGCTDDVYAFQKKHIADCVPHKALDLSLWGSILICAILLAITVHSGNMYLILGAVVFVVFGFPNLTSFLFVPFPDYADPAENKHFLRNHAAQHKVINFAERYERPGSVEEVQEQSNIAAECGCSNVAAFLFLAILAGVLISLLPEIGAPLAIGIMVIAVFYVIFSIATDKLNIFKYFQNFAVCMPEDSDVELAVAAYGQLYDNVQNGKAFASEHK